MPPARSGLRGEGAHRSAVRAPARASAPAARCAAARRGGGRRRRARLPSARRPSASAARWPGCARHAAAGAARGAARRAGAAAAGSLLRLDGGGARGRGHRGPSRAGTARCGTGRARAARRAAAAVRAAPLPALGYVSRARRGRTSPGTPGCSTRWPRRSARSTWRCCRSAAGGRIWARSIWTRGGRRRRWPARAARAVPVHYGTYWPIGMDAVRPHEFHAPGEEFVRQAGAAAPEVAVHRLGHGESVSPEVAR